MRLTCSFVAPGRIVASMMHRSESSQAGPEIMRKPTPYAVARRILRVGLTYLIRLGSEVPGPPSVRTDQLPSRLGAKGFTVATSNSSLAVD
jgi:hypothetical protein